MQALEEYEAGVCGGCGFHSSIADTDPYFTLDERVCPVCSDVAREQRIRDEREDKATEKAAASTPRPSDGRTRFIRLMGPDEILQLRQSVTGTP